jgi:hypothetical protein
LKVLKFLSEKYSPIINPKIANIVCKIIQKQNNLEEFKIERYSLNSIFLTLEFQKHSLVSIEFLFICFSNISIKNFINLHKLNYLKFEGCRDKKPLNRYEILQFASFKLKKLEFINNTWNGIIEPTIIKYLGASLLIFKYNMSKEITSLANNLSINVTEIVFDSIYNLSLIKIFLENCHNYLEKISLKCSFIKLVVFDSILYYIEKSNNRLKFLNIETNIFDDEKLRRLDEIKAKGIIIHKISEYL